MLAPVEIDQQPFSRTAMRWIVGVVLVSFTLSMVLLVFTDPPTTAGSWEPNTSSYSAIGHKGLVELLKKLDRPVLVSGYQSGKRAAEAGLLVLSEPDSGRRDDIIQLMDEGARILVILPKWYAESDADNPDWVTESRLAYAGWIREILNALSLPSDLIRYAGPAADLEWRHDDITTEPTIASPQLLDPSDVHPIMVCDEGVLLGWLSWNDDRVFVLSDPDILSNHGLGRGDNAVLAMEIFDHLCAPDDVIVFDETLHGFGGEPGFWREMLTFPLVLVLAHALLTTLVLVWAGMSRFGAPRKPPPGILAGKESLIDNTAELVRFGGHSGHSLGRYFVAALRDVSGSLHAPEGLERAALINWLRALGKARGRVRDLGALEKAVETVAREGRRRKGQEHRVVKAARDIHAWREEILHGSGSDQRSH